VLEAMDGFYRHDNANVHRGIHELSNRATEAYEGARAVARFFGIAGPAS
jgi:cysteine desulfurase / selenocysteine lyase